MYKFFGRYGTCKPAGIYKISKKFRLLSLLKGSEFAEMSLARWFVCEEIAFLSWSKLTMHKQA